MANVYYLDKLYNIAKLHGDKNVNFKVAKPSDNYDAANKHYVDTAIDGIGGSGSSGGVSKCSDCANTFAALQGSNQIAFSVNEPTEASHATSKNYVDTKLSNFEMGYSWANTDSKDYYMTVSKSDLYRLDKLQCSVLKDGLYLIAYTISAKVQFKNANSGDVINNSFGVYRESKILSFSHMRPFHVKLSSGASTYYYSASMSFLANLEANNTIQVYLYYVTTNSNISTDFYYGRKYVGNSSLVAVRVGPKYSSN